MKDFKKDFDKLYKKLINKENFAFSKYADGELRILKGIHINLLNKENGEFQYVPNSTDEKYRQSLLDSFQYQHPDYIVGIGCPCCIGQEDFEWMKENSKQSDETLTWANIFVNGNYLDYQEKIIPEYSKRSVVMICNSKATVDTLPFELIKIFRVGRNAWKSDFGLIEELKTYISDNNIKNYLFLFAAGPFGNLLAHQVFEHSQENTYIDVGSTLDPYMGLGRTRGYLRGAGTLKKVCTWN